MNPQLVSRRLALCIVSVFLAGGLSPRLSAQLRYIITDLGPIGRSVTTDPYDLIPINASGQVALWQANADQTIVRAVRWRDGTFTDLGVLAGTDTASKAWGMNDSGQIVGSSGTMTAAGTSVSFSRRRGVLFTATGPQAIGVSASALHGISATGVMVGDSTGRPIMFDGTTVRDLGTLGGTTGTARAINAAGQIVGSSPNASAQRRAFLYENGAMRDLGTLGGGTSSAEAINVTGQIVGFSARADGLNRAFLYSGGQMSELPTIGVGVTDMRAFAINASGQIVGYYSTPTPRPFLFSGGVATDLNTLVALRVGTGNVGFSALSFASGINDAGQITGIGTYFVAGATSSASHAYLLTPAAKVSPVALTLPTGGGVFVLEVTPALPATAFQWLRNGTAIAGATQQSFVVVEATSAQNGSYACRVTTASGDYLSNDAVVASPADANGGRGRLINLSVLTSLANAADTFSLGTVVGGPGTFGTKPLLARAGGPSLVAFGLDALLSDPRLEFFSGQTKSAENNDWGGDASVGAIAAQVGAFAFASGASRDAALYLSASPAGDTSVRVSGTGAGRVIAEIYDATPDAEFAATTPRLVNLSVLKPLGTGFSAGFVIGGTTAQTVLVRVVGPTLASAFNVSGAAADPRLTLYAGTTKLAENDNWGVSATAPWLNLITARAGAFFLPNDSKDAALIISLVPGSYSVVAEPVGTSGTALVEVYEVP